MEHRTSGKLGVLLVGLGAVSTTLLAGLVAVRSGKGKPYGSLSQMGKIYDRERSEWLAVRELVSLSALEDLVFCSWDLFPENAFLRAQRCNVLTAEHLGLVERELKGHSPYPGVYLERFAPRLLATHRKSAGTLDGLVRQVDEDIERFLKSEQCDRAVLVYCGSTEASVPPACHQSIAEFEAGLRENNGTIAPSQIYAYCALKKKIPFVNATPNPCCELPVFSQLAEENAVPICGSDLKSGQTFLKTLIAKGLRDRALGVTGWFSTNILGNLDGYVLEDAATSSSKIASKSEALENILSSVSHPELYGELEHLVKINYFKTRGDNKEAWDTIDIRGWLGYEMQLKLNLLARDSILAAPMVLDLILFADLAHRNGWSGPQLWLSAFFKRGFQISDTNKTLSDFPSQYALFEETISKARV